MLRSISPIAIAAPLVLAACAVAPPQGPSVLALPAQGKSFAQFQQEDATCRYAARSRPGLLTPTRRPRKARSAAPPSARRSAPRRGPRLVRRPAIRGPGRRSARAAGCWSEAASGPATPTPRRPRCSSGTTWPTRNACTTNGNTVQASAPLGWPSYGGYPAYGYPYYGPLWGGSTVALGFGGWGWGWGGWGWGGGWRRGWGGGWRGGGWHGGGWRGGGRR